MVGVCTIPALGTAGNSIRVSGAGNYVFYPPAVLDGATTFTLQGSPDGTVWCDVQSGGVDVTFTAAKVLAFAGKFEFIRVLASAAVAANRAFSIDAY